VMFKRGDKDEVVPVVAGSASLKGRTLFVTLTNAHATAGAQVTVNLLGDATATDANGSILTGEIHAHNAFDQPEAVKPQPFAIATRGASLVIELPPASVVALETRLS
jgi:alpha-N-arabinofuranosidase